MNNNKHAVYRYVPAILSATRYQKKIHKIPQVPRSFFFGWIRRVSRCQAKESAAFCNSLSCDPYSCSCAGKPGKMMNVWIGMICLLFKHGYVRLPSVTPNSQYSRRNSHDMYTQCKNQNWNRLFQTHWRNSEQLVFLHVFISVIQCPMLNHNQLLVMRWSLWGWHNCQLIACLQWIAWYFGGWCNNHLEKWWSSSMGRMTSHLWNGKKNETTNLY